MTNTRMQHTIRLGLAAALLVAGLAAQAQPTTRLLPAQPGDLVPAQTQAARRVDGADLERAPVTFFQALAADQRLDFAPAPFRTDSREYWQQVTDRQLRAGYALALTAPAAVVLISPSVRAEPLLRTQLAILSGGNRYSAEEATDTLVDAEALRAAGMDVRPGSVGFRLRAGYEADAAVQIADAHGDYVLHVLEPESDAVLGLQARTDVTHAGGRVELSLALAGGGGIDHAAGLLVAPDGSSFDLHFRQSTRAGLVAHVDVPAAQPAQVGLWELRTTIGANVGGRAFQRDARTAVAIVTPTARLDGSVEVYHARVDGSLVTTFGVEVATAGRFEVRAVLFGQDDKGATVATGVAHAAAWLDAGSGSLALTWPAAALDGLSGPYQVRDLRLSDQSAVALLERRSRAVTID